MITNKTQLQKDIDTIDQLSDTAILAASAFAQSLNNLFNTIWSLPEDRLLSLLQRMYDDGTLLTMFGNHNYAATSINTILNNGNHQGIRAYDTAPREIQIIDSIISFKVNGPIIENIDSINDNTVYDFVE
jgi:hypothetical protein